MTNIINFYIGEIRIYLISDYNVIDYKLSNNQINEQNTIVCLLTSWYKSETIIRIINENKNYHMIILANTEEEKQYYENQVTCDVIFVNKNAFLNENVFIMNNFFSKKYDLVIDSCFCEYKNRIIASKILNTVHIGYYKKANNIIENEFIPNFGIKVNYDTNNLYHKLTSREICDIYNQSHVGGIFSDKEGACLSSTQYLLCGLPVVSTKSKGGRDVWYNENNSIICENNDDDCYRCVQLVKQKLENGEFNGENIRNNTINLMNHFRNELIHFLIQKIKKIYNIDIDKTKLHINLSHY